MSEHVQCGDIFEIGISVRCPVFPSLLWSCLSDQHKFEVKTESVRCEDFDGKNVSSESVSFQQSWAQGRSCLGWFGCMIRSYLMNWIAQLWMRPCLAWCFFFPGAAGCNSVLAGRLTDWLTDWLTEWLTEWLTDFWGRFWIHSFSRLASATYRVALEGQFFGRIRGATYRIAIRGPIFGGLAGTIYRVLLGGHILGGLAGANNSVSFGGTYF